MHSSDSLRLRCQVWLAPLYARLPAPRGRNFHAYCIGLPRSGTHSIAAMLERDFAAAHEPALGGTIGHTLAWLQGRRSTATMQALLRARDRHLALELEAAHPLHHLTPLLVETFPQARFILTVREPLSWLESELNKNLETRTEPLWRALENYRYSLPGLDFQAEESVLRKLDNVHPIGAYLSYWRKHLELVLDTVPDSRLLVLRTSELQENGERIAAFLGIKTESLDLLHARSDARPTKRIALNEHVDEAFLAQQVVEHCGELAHKLFPETWKSERFA